MTSRIVRSSIAACTLVALTLAAAACGGSDKSASSSTTTATTSAVSPGSAPTSTSRVADRSDNDGDSTGKGPYDSDDQSVLNFGTPADRTTTAAIAAIVRRYYAVAVSENGTKACSMLYSIYAEAVAEDYGTSPPGPAYARGTTCPAVLTAVFKHFHKELATRLPRLKVSAVRVDGRQGVALLSFGSSAKREIRVSREGHQWKILALVDNELP